MLVVWSVNRPTCCAEWEVIIRFWDRSSVLCWRKHGLWLKSRPRSSNHWDIETKAGIDISLSRFAAKSHCCAVLLTLRFISVKLPSIGMLSTVHESGVTRASCAARAHYHFDIRLVAVSYTLPSFSGQWEVPLCGKIWPISSADRSGTSGSSLLTDSRKAYSSSVSSDQIFAVSSRSGYNGALTQAIRNSPITVSCGRT